MAETLLNESGQLAATAGVLYTCPASTQAIVREITLVNTDTVVRVVNVYYRASGGALRQITPVDLSMAAGYSVELDKVETLSAGDTIEGDADAATVVDFSVFGVEIT